LLPDCYHQFSDVVGGQAGMFRDPTEHFRADLFIVVEMKYVRTALRMGQFDVRAPLGSNSPADTLQRAQHSFCLGTRPMTQADFSRTLIDEGISLEASTSSATA
jgi:hypothetical protein